MTSKWQGVGSFRITVLTYFEQKIGSYIELHAFHQTKKQIVESFTGIPTHCRQLSKMSRNFILGHLKKIFQPIASESKIKFSKSRSSKFLKKSYLAANCFQHNVKHFQREVEIIRGVKK